MYLIGKLHDEGIVKVYKKFYFHDSFSRAAYQDRAKKLLLDGLDWLSYLERCMARKNKLTPKTPDY